MIILPGVLGRPVMTESNQVKLGRVAGMIIDIPERRLAGLLIGKRGLFHRSLVLPIENILKSTDENLIVAGKKSLVKKNDPGFNKLLRYPFEFIGIQVQDSSGKTLGRVASSSFCLQDGLLAELEISKGSLASLAGGRQVIHGDLLLSLQPGLIVVKSADDQKQVRGGIIQKASLFSRRLVKLRDEAEKLVVKREARFAVGKAAGRVVRDSRNQVIVNAGDTITPEHIKQAAERDCLHQLALAAGVNDIKKGWRDWTKAETAGDETRPDENRSDKEV